ncbi:hypothetical protein G9A89_012175 [Geosiphon pyriformis]|nr:hypothetical protein G9A89_012175 [Geosiphon pyriformis]
MAQQIEDNQKMHLEFTFLVFALALQMAATFFAAQTSDPNKQLIDRLTANLVWLLELLAQAQNTVIGDMVFVPGAGVINSCILLVINTNSA